MQASFPSIILFAAIIDRLHMVLFWISNVNPVLGAGEITLNEVDMPPTWQKRKIQWRRQRKNCKYGNVLNGEWTWDDGLLEEKLSWSWCHSSKTSVVCFQMTEGQPGKDMRAQSYSRQRGACVCVRKQEGVQHYQEVVKQEKKSSPCSPQKGKHVYASFNWILEKVFCFVNMWDFPHLSTIFDVGFTHGTVEWFFEEIFTKCFQTAIGVFFSLYFLHVF